MRLLPSLQVLQWWGSKYYFLVGPQRLMRCTTWQYYEKSQQKVSCKQGPWQTRKSKQNIEFCWQFLGKWHLFKSVDPFWIKDSPLAQHWTHSNNFLSKFTVLNNHLCAMDTNLRIANTWYMLQIIDYKYKKEFTWKLLGYLPKKLTKIGCNWDLIPTRSNARIVP